MPPRRDTQAPTVNDLRVKACYICQEEEVYNEPVNPPKAWTHPCNCKLVAHEECLLKWIQASQKSKSSLECPQCKAKYVIESNKPLIYQLLDAGNQTLNTMGTLTLVAGTAAVCGLIGTSTYIVCTGYGAWAVEKFIGKELYQLCYGDDPANWPWTAYLNLPLVPFSLVLSRFPFTSGLLCSFPIFIAWPRYSNRILLERWSQSEDTRILPSPPSYWPPTPFLFAALGVPIIRNMYSVAYRAVYRKVMGENPPRNTFTFGRRNEFRVGGADAAMMIRVENDPAVPEQGAQEQLGRANAEAEPEENVLQIKLSAVGRRIGSGLIIPLLASYMGRLLFRVSQHSSILRSFLGIRQASLGASMSWLPPPSTGKEKGGWSLLGQVNGLRILMEALSGGTDAPMDPVWWRNTVGLGFFVAAKDCVHLLYLYLAKKELESRHVKSKPFIGVDLQTLDLVPDFFTRGR